MENLQKNFDVDDMLMDGVIGGASGAIGTSGKQTLKVAGNTSKTKGLKSIIKKIKNASKTVVEEAPDDFTISLTTNLASSDYMKNEYKRAFGR